MSSDTQDLKLKWPRGIEGDPRLAQLETLLARDRRPLWENGSIEVAQVAFTPGLERTLFSLNGLGQLERGLENIGGILASEKKGIEVQRLKQGAPVVRRVSRLLLIAEGGSERFYRGCERLLLDHSDRLLGLRVDVADAQLMEKLYGPGALAKALLISHRDAVIRTIESLIDGR